MKATRFTKNIFGYATLLSVILLMGLNLLLPAFPRLSNLFSARNAALIWPTDDNDIAFLYQAGNQIRKDKVPDEVYQMASTFPTDRLEHLVREGDHTTRIYAFWALLDRRSFDPVSILEHQMEHRISGKIVIRCYTQDMYSDDAMFYLATIRGYNPRFLLNEDQLTKVDSLLIHKPNTFWLREGAVERNRRNPDFYDGFRYLALVEGYAPALVALAEFKKAQDADAIFEYIEEAVRQFKVNDKSPDYEALSRAMILYPDPRYVPLLATLLEFEDGFSYVSEQLLEAVAVEKTPAALKLLEYYASSENQKMLDGIASAIGQHLTPLYEPLMWRLLETKNTTNIDIFEFLFERNRQRAATATLGMLDSDSPLPGVVWGLSRDVHFYYPGYDDGQFYDHEGPSALQTLYEYTPTVTKTLILEKLNHHNEDLIESYVWVGGWTGDADIQNAILQIASEHKNLHMRQQAALALRLNSDPIIHAQAYKLSKKNVADMKQQRLADSGK